MNLKRIVGIVVCILGIILIFVSSYIKNQVDEGNERIAAGKEKVQQGKTLFGLNPVTKEIGQKAIFDSADRKIKAGEQEAETYGTLANRLRIGGIVLIVAGLGIIFVPGKKKRL